MMPLRCRQIAVALLAWLLAAVAPGQPLETLHYELSPDYEHGTLRVRLTWQTGKRKSSALRIAPSFGRIDNVPRLLKNVRITGGRVKHRENVWLIGHHTAATIEAQYTVDAGRRLMSSLDEIHYPVVTRSWFCGLGSVFLLVPANMIGSPPRYEVVVRWKLPAGYKAVCSWGSGRHVGAVLSPADLRDSVYLAGRIKTARRTVAQREVTVALVDSFAFSAGQFADMTARIIAAQCEFMHETGFPDYVVTAVPVGEALGPGEARLAGSGLYHSFALFVAPEARLDDTIEHLFSHELFHYWNGRTLQAAEPERNVYWFIEGFTDYYALRTLYESDYWPAGTYLKWINKHVRGYYQNPAIGATNADICRDYWRRRDTVGEMAYQRGLMLGVRWHYLARQHGVASGLDRLMIALVDRGRRGQRLTNELIRQTGVELLGDWFGEEFDRYVVRAERIELPPEALGPEFTGRPTTVYSYQLGFDRQRSEKERRIRGLIPGSAAARAGLRSGDRIEAWSIYPDPDKTCRIKVSRNGRSRVISFRPRGEKMQIVQFHLRSRASKR